VTSGLLSESVEADGSRTPVHVLRVGIGAFKHTLFLKDERVNPTGSIKDRAARALVRGVAADARGGHVGMVESTSGNMGAALAREARRLGIRFRAITDPNLPPDLAEIITSFGGEIETVRDCDRAGNYLDARRERVRHYSAQGDWLWTNQYASEAAWRVHHDRTGPELLTQVSDGFDEILLAASTCGTLAGLGGFVRATVPGARVVAVDVDGSTVFGGQPGRRWITGIGSTRTPDFDLTNCYDTVEVVPELAAIHSCLWLLGTTGIGVGASTGAVIAACLRRLTSSMTPMRAVAFIADGASNYRRTLYDRSWRRRNGFVLDRPWFGGQDGGRNAHERVSASFEHTLP
jgi:cysteine synthase